MAKLVTIPTNVARIARQASLQSRATTQRLERLHAKREAQRLTKSAPAPAPRGPVLLTTKPKHGGRAVLPSAVGRGFGGRDLSNERTER